MHRKPFKDCYWVEPDKFLAGRYPGSVSSEPAREKIRALLASGIQVFVDLTEEGENGLRPYHILLEQESAALSRPVQHVRFPIRDVDIAPSGDIARILRFINECMLSEQPVYLHCRGGHGRTGMIVGCYLVDKGLNGNDALRRVAQLHSETSKPDYPSPETREQKQVVLSWVLRNRILGSLLGGAVGDALGYPVEFLSLADIRKRYGPQGIREFPPTGVDLG